MSRTRSRFSQSKFRYLSEGFQIDGTKIWTSDTSYDYSYKIAEITDEPHGKGRFNPVSHMRNNRSAVDINLPLAANSAGTGRSYVQITNFRRGYEAPVTCNLDWDSAVDSLIADAMGSMPIEANLVVNAIEIMQLKSLASSLLSGIFQLGGKRQKIGKLTAKEIANQHLAISFGVLPLISDFRGLMGMRSTINKRIKELESRNGKVIRLSKRVQATGSASGIIWADTSGIHPMECFVSTKSNFTGVVSCDVSGFTVDDAQTRAKAWVSATGLTSPFTAAWELIPFSFVIDWFVPIGRKIQAQELRLGLSNLSQHVNCGNFGFSVKETRASQTNIVIHSTTYPAWEGIRTKGASLNGTYYSRTVGIPSGRVPVLPSGWSVTRTALSISLLIQKLRK